MVMMSGWKLEPAEVKPLPDHIEAEHLAHIEALKEAELSPGIYTRQRDGTVSPITFDRTPSVFKTDMRMMKPFVPEIERPDVDVVYVDGLGVTAERARFTLSFVDFLDREYRRYAFEWDDHILDVVFTAAPKVPYSKDDFSRTLEVTQVQRRSETPVFKSVKETTRVLAILAMCLEAENLGKALAGKPKTDAQARTCYNDVYLPQFDLVRLGLVPDDLFDKSPKKAVWGGVL